MSYFKTSADGRKLFFPWGYLSKGYLIASEADDARIKRMRMIFLSTSLALLILALGLQRQNPFAPYILAAAFIAAYAVWTHFAVAGLQRTEERLTLREIMVSHPKVYSPWLLWPLEIGALLFVIGGLVILMKDPSHWPSTLSGVIFFALCAASFAFILVVRASFHRSNN